MVVSGQILVQLKRLDWLANAHVLDSHRFDALIIEIRFLKKYETVKLKIMETMRNTNIIVACMC